MCTDVKVYAPALFFLPRRPYSLREHSRSGHWLRHYDFLFLRSLHFLILSLSVVVLPYQLLQICDPDRRRHAPMLVLVRRVEEVDDGVGRVLGCGIVGVMRWMEMLASLLDIVCIIDVGVLDIVWLVVRTTAHHSSLFPFG